MRITKFLIGGLIGVHAGSIAKWSNQDNLSLLIFFLRKDFALTQTLTSENQLTKQK